MKLVHAPAGVLSSKRNGVKTVSRQNKGFFINKIGFAVKNTKKLSNFTRALTEKKSRVCRSEVNYRACGTLPEGVTLVAVSKTHAPALIEEAYAAGQRIFGESRPQELAAKYEALPKDIEWHMIGHLQTNKVKLIAPFVALIHSADSERLIRVINDEAIRNGRVIDILLEIHVADEETKSGWTYDALLKYVKSGALAAMKGVRVRGVMGIATYTSNEFRVRLDFELLQQYKKELEAYFDSSFDTLSMGMSDDYPLALDYGTTMVRIGSLIFGKRDYAAAEKEATV